MVTDELCQGGLIEDLEIWRMGPDAVAHASNPTTLGGQGGWIREVGSLRPAWPAGKTPSLLKIQKLARHGATPVMPATGGWVT